MRIDLKLASAFAGLCLLSGLATAAAKEVEAVLADGQRFVATLTEYQFNSEVASATLVAEGKSVTTQQLLLWGEPSELENRVSVVLTDGSRLFSDRPWSLAGLVGLEGDQVSLRHGSGRVTFDRGVVQWILLSPEAGGLDPERLPKSGSDTDVVVLRGGDQLVGKVTKLDGQSLVLQVAGEEVDSPLQGIAAVRFANPVVASTGSCLIGLNGGSLLKASSCRISNGKFTATLLGTTLQGEAAEVAFLQPIQTELVTYLSDLDPIDYRHTPYLDLPWPLAVDRGLLGTNLIGGGQRAAKGLAVHSAARVIYRLTERQQTFQAEIAVADPNDQHPAEGSVVFRVYLVREGQFEKQYESDIVRTGDPAQPISIDTSGAAAIALVVDYADNGDAGDHALWLNARLVTNK